ncbi:ATP-binding protein [Leptolyngbya boryana CZ1]|uniref:histidine kinase n=1 Tax=Leptolyngbya boryana CZ1 TaxID=3060204 RepID=A0AA96WPG3_LEPBY|nr:ATP-binding protein [Leptolyngbya boryana]WNZ43353.1 ATP-binding protein [Leptolyngbya boryana CZ1]
MKRAHDRLMSGGMGLALLLLLGAGIASLRSIENLVDAQQWVIHTDQVINKLDRLFSDVRFVEGSRRAYVITRQSTYLDLYYGAIRKTQQQLIELRELTQDNFSQQQRINEIDILVAARLEIVRQSIEDFDKDPSDSQRQIELTNQGWKAQQKVQKKLDELKAIEFDLMQQRIKATRENVVLSTRLAVMGYLISLGLLLCLYWLFRRTKTELTERVKRRTAELADVNQSLQESKLQLEAKVEARTLELNALNCELQRSNQELERFAYIASHDLREPLRAIISYSQLLEMDYRDKLDDTADQYLSYIIGGGQHMQALIKDLLTYSRTGTSNLKRTLVNCNEVVQQALVNLQVAISESHAEIELDSLPTINVDQTQLMQLFQNLIANAIKFQREQSPKIYIGSRSTQLQEQETEHLFFVRDNGIGIKPEYLDRIFEVFRRLHPRSDFPGTGIGLAICKRVVEAHGGKIWAESELGSGTTFYFTLISKA